MRSCARCGGPIPPNRKAGAEYCSQKCNQSAYRARKKNDVGRTATNGERHASPHPRRETEPDIGRREFDRMMDGSIEDMLRANRDRLRRALDDPDTPAGALPAISRQLIAVCRELENSPTGDPLLDLADDITEDTDAGASIV